MGSLFLRTIFFALGATFFMTGCSRPPSPPAIKQPVSFKVVMKKYSITPAELRVKTGDVVHLEVSTSDVQHGFDIPDLNISEPVNPGRPAHITFTAAKKGEL